MNVYQPYTIFPLGDSALTIDFGNFISEELNKKVLEFYAQLKNREFPFIKDIIPAYGSLTVVYDGALLYPELKEDETVFETIAVIIENLSHKPVAVEQPREIIRIPVCYSKRFAPDIEFLAEAKNMDVIDIINLHTSLKYRVYMLGFLPGFAYMGQVDERLSIPRKPQPRLNVAEGSVGIAGRQTGIYPLTSPGGWQLIGRTPQKIFDRKKQEPVFFRPGDEVEFYSINEDEFKDYKARNS
jgi:inhibitor of KinA